MPGEQRMVGRIRSWGGSLVVDNDPADAGAEAIIMDGVSQGWFEVWEVPADPPAPAAYLLRPAGPGALSAAERAYVQRAADEMMTEVKLGDVPAMLGPVACGCSGGPTPGGPCHCQLAYEALCVALARCGLRPKAEEERRVG